MSGIKTSFTNKHKRSNSHSGHEFILNEVFLVMEFRELDCKKLIESMKDGTELTENHVKTIFYNSLCGLKSLHKIGIIHRDIKPANLLITSECAVTYCDFGLARVMPKREDQRQQKTEKEEPSTRKRDMSPHVVTRMYRAPELILLDP